MLCIIFLLTANCLHMDVLKNKPTTTTCIGIKNCEVLCSI